MDLKTFKKIKSLSKTDSIYILNGKAYFYSSNGVPIWVTIDTNLKDGHYEIKNNKLVWFRKADMCESQLGFGIDLDKENFMMVDVTGIPYDIVNYVRRIGIPDDALEGIFIDSIYKCIVATDGRALYSHPLKDIPASILIRPEFWKLIHHFKLTQIYFDGKYAFAKGEGVTIVSELITESVYPSWFHCVPVNDTHIEITDTIKKSILEALKLLKPHYTWNHLITFDGMDIKVVSNAGCSFKVDIGVELFPDKIITFDSENLKKVLKIAQGYINFPRSVIAPVTIRSDDAVSLIMPLPLPDNNILNTTFVELETV